MASKKAKKKTTAKVKKTAKPKAAKKSKVKPVKAKSKAKSNQKPQAKLKSNVAKTKKSSVKPSIKTSAKMPAAKPTSKVDYSKAITPLGDRLVVRIVNNERVTAGGLIIPDTVSEAVGFLKATVLAVGRGTQSKKGFIKTMDVQIGDSVLFSQHAGTKVKFNAEELQIIHETDVMGIVQK